MEKKTSAWHMGEPPKEKSVPWMVRTSSNKTHIVLSFEGLFRKIDGKKGLGETISGIMLFRPLSEQELVAIKSAVESVSAR